MSVAYLYGEESERSENVFYGILRRASSSPAAGGQCTYVCSGRARALRYFAANPNVYRAARAAPLQDNDYFGIKVGVIGRAASEARPTLRGY